MKFCHRLEVNDPSQPLQITLNREQLWLGLVLRAENPKIFVPWLDDCRISRRQQQHLARELQYGDLTIVDEVSFSPPSRLCIRVPAQGDLSASSLTVTIEEPQPDLLIVCFEYLTDTPSEKTADEAFYDEYRRAAYVDADLNTIQRIRQLAAAGDLKLPGTWREHGR